MRPGLLTLFLKRYGDINRRNETGMPLLEEEIAEPDFDADRHMTRKSEMVRILLPQGARPKEPDAYGGTALTETALRTIPSNNSPDARALATQYRALLKT